MNYDGVKFIDFKGNNCTMRLFSIGTYKMHYDDGSSGLIWSEEEITRAVADGSWKLGKESLVLNFLWENALAEKK